MEDRRKMVACLELCGKSDRESARLEILALENQLNEQEKCHLEQIAMLENERRLNAQDREAERNQYESRIGELSNHIQT